MRCPKTSMVAVKGSNGMSTEFPQRQPNNKCIGNSVGFFIISSFHPIVYTGKGKEINRVNNGSQPNTGKDKYFTNPVFGGKIIIFMLLFINNK